jgi:hypothetical protein
MTISYKAQLDYVLGNPDVKQKLFMGRLDSEIASGTQRLTELFRGMHWEKRAIEDTTLKDLYRADKSDETIINEAREIKKEGRLDANDGLIFERQLTMIDPRYMEVKHKPLGKWREVLPIQPFTPGLDKIVYRQFDFTGEAKLNGPGDTSVNYANATGKEYENKVHAYNSGYQLTFQDLRRAAFAGAPLQRSNMTAVNRAFEGSLQKGMFVGRTDIGINGFFNHPGVPDSASAGGVWAGLGSEAIKDVIVGMPIQIMTDYDTAFGEDGFVICLPVKQYQLIYSKILTTSGVGTKSIAAWILENYPAIKGFVQIADLKGAGAGSTDLAICYQKEPDFLEAQVADSIIWQAPQFDGLAINFPAEMEFGGVAVRYPLSMTQRNTI